VADLSQLLHYLMEQRGSDLLVKVGSSPHLRLDGRLHPTPLPALGPAEIEGVVAELLPLVKAEELLETGEVDVAHSVSGLGRFRINVYRQRSSLSLAIRRVVPGAPSINDLSLPPMMEKLADEEHGLILVTGPAASGKTTTVAGLIDHVNATQAKHIVTLEDPIEVLHSDKMSLVSQREIGTDTGELLGALRRVGRQNADVIFVSDIKNGDVAAEVLSEAASGRLVIATMATLSSVETINKIIDFFPPHGQRQARHSLASVLRGVVAQRLLERSDGRGRVPAVEMMMGTPKVFEAIVSGGDERALDQLIREGEYHGMQTFDQALFQLYKDNLIGVRDALSAASRPEDLRISLQQAGLAASY
jgi:twitching motility protein PilT